MHAYVHKHSHIHIHTPHTHIYIKLLGNGDRFSSLFVSLLSDSVPVGSQQSRLCFVVVLPWSSALTLLFKGPCSLFLRCHGRQQGLLTELKPPVLSLQCQPTALLEIQLTLQRSGSGTVKIESYIQF